MLKAYFDDSNMSHGPHAVLAGWVEQANNWERFSKDWDAVLRMSPRIEYFKWNDFRSNTGQFFGVSPEMAAEKMRLLAGLLADYQPFGVANIISNDLHRQIFGENPDPIMRGPYFLSFYSVVAQLVEFLAHRGISDQVDFIFDIQPGQMDAAYASWDRLIEIAPPEAKKLIASVGFHDDVKLAPLQAADLSAGWVREQVT